MACLEGWMTAGMGNFMWSWLVEVLMEQMYASVGLMPCLAIAARTGSREL